jgi:predicted permease
MSLSVCADCGEPSPWAGIVQIALAWALPTVIFVVLRQLGPDFRHRRALTVVLWLAILGSSLATLFLLDVLDSSDATQRLAAFQLGRGAVLAVAAVAFYRSGQRGHREARS